MSTVGHHHCPHCHQEYDLSSGRGVQLKDMYGNTVSPPKNEQESLHQLEQRVRPHCTSHEAHPLPPHDAVLIGVYGPVSAGKNALLTSMDRSAGEAGVLQRIGVSAAAADEDQSAWTHVRRIQATAPASANTPHAQLRLSIEANGKPRSVILYNTSGEEFRPEGRLQIDAPADLRTGCPFTPELDVIVVVVPPQALLRDIEANPGRESIGAVISGIQSIAQFVHARDLPRRVRDRERSVILALTKCDKYHHVTDFPKQLIKPRKRQPIKQTIADEQPLIAKFILDHGGRGIMDAAARIAKPVFLTAISGTGADMPGEAPSPHSDSRRSLDPLLISMMRRDWGKYE